MSNGNLLKRSFLSSTAASSRIIDTNALIAERIGALQAELKQPENTGFTEGLRVEEIDVSALVSDEEIGENETAEIDPGMTPEEAEEQAREILQEAKDAAGRILQEAIAQGEQECTALREAARQQGYQEGFQKAEREFAEKERELAEREAAMAQEFEQLVAELEPQFIDALTGIYEHIFHVELSGYRDILLHLMTDCLKGVDGGKNFQIFVSPDDFTYVNTKKNRLLEAAGRNAQVEVLEDTSLHKNACIIKTENGIMDCGLGTQLDELTKRLKLLSYEKH